MAALVVRLVRLGWAKQGMATAGNPGVGIAISESSGVEKATRLGVVLSRSIWFFRIVLCDVTSSKFAGMVYAVIDRSKEFSYA